MYPGVWRHGDWIEITARGTAIIYGRSDSTINRSGIRMGTSEIYRAVLGIDAIVDALVVDVPRPGTEGWMPLFVVLREGAELDDELRAEIARRVREQCSPRHVPDEVFQIAEVPRTLSGKVLEVPVKRILMGTPAEKAASRDSLANPAALDYFVEMAARLEADRRRSGGAPAQGRGAQRQQQHGRADDDGDVERAARRPATPLVVTLFKRLEGVGQRHRVGDGLQDAGHLVAGDEQPAEQQLREDDRGHELHGLELGPGEGADEEAERHAEQRVADRERRDRQRSSPPSRGRAGRKRRRWSRPPGPRRRAAKASP